MKYLHVKNFKCFQDVEIAFNQLTIFVGANGFGKSSAIQALLFLRHTLEECCDEDEDQFSQLSISSAQNIKIIINEKYDLALGYSSSILNKETHDSGISIAFKEENEEQSFASYSVNSVEDELWVNLQELQNDIKIYSPLLTHEFYYLNTERVGPRIIHPIRYTNFLHTGWKGELTAQVINFNGGREKVSKERMFPESKNENLDAQVNFWLDYIMPGVRITASTDTKTLTSRILIENQLTKNDPVLATNIGFGISYILPIIVTGLIAKKGTFFIVENPEAHLHPSAQSKIGRFLAMVSKSGVYVIAETHSDHVINGIQIASAKDPFLSDKVTINYFSLDEELKQPSIKAIKMTEKGDLSEWPKGFFDQSQLDYLELLKIRGHV